MKNLISQFRNLPVKSKRLLGLGVVVSLTIALPLFIWSVVNMTFNPKEKASEIIDIPTHNPRISPGPAGECEMCGGIIGISCEEGLICQMSRPPYPDQSGICVKARVGSNCPLRTVSPSPSPTASPSPSPSASPSPSPTASPSPSASPSASPSPSESPSPTALSFILGDVNRDGRINSVDIGLIVDNYRSTPPSDIRADVNEDGTVNMVDLGIVINNYGKSTQ